MKEIPIKEIKKILILQLAGIGDLVIATPTLKALRKEVDCKRPCYKFKCKNRKCMKLITVEDVTGAVKRYVKN